MSRTRTVHATAAVVQPHWFAAPLAAATYPFLLAAFHEAATAIGRGAGAGAGAWIGAGLALLAALAMPAVALWAAMRLGRIESPSPAELAARRTALLAVAVPPMFTLTGVLAMLLGHPDWDIGFLLALWTVLAVRIASAGRASVRPAAGGSAGNWRVAHGGAAVLAILFLMAHFSNHLVGLLGPEAHTAVMKVLRVVYRSAVMEPILIGVFAFLILTGLRLAWRWSARPMDRARSFQVAGGVFVTFAAISHLNAVLYLARVHFGIDTDWAFATGAPAGMLMDPWNIRLLPYYLGGVFFVVAHAFCGLRIVMLAHHMPRVLANRVLAGGTVFAGLLASVIILAMCGVRIHLA
ncbi:hypothetical protein [Massilia niastensis]|uniref:hypothetical protein n=1 Tax=Massilia niastensis TaxID=544911 RepID=UPI0003740B21|nr:hypothetical protein [Massilia niastensis]